MKGLKDNKGKFVKNIPINKECPVCLNAFTPRLEKQKFCGRVCMGKSYTKNRSRDCVICKKTFSAKTLATRFCSQECYTESGIRTRIGPANHLWRGGLTPIKSVIRTSGKYKKWVKAVLARDKFTCVECGVFGVSFHVDHIIPFSAIIEKIRFQYGEENILEIAMNGGLLWDINNGRTLCISCHKATDSYLNRNANKI